MTFNHVTALLPRSRAKPSVERLIKLDISFAKLVTYYLSFVSKSPFIFRLEAITRIIYSCYLDLLLSPKCPLQNASPYSSRAQVSMPLGCRKRTPR
jgi:hypothetical protein